MLKSILSEVFYGGKIIKREGNIILTAGQNTYDTNFHLYDLNEGAEYLLDIGDLEMAISSYTVEELKALSWKQFTM